MRWEFRVTCLALMANIGLTGAHRACADDLLRDLQTAAIVRDSSPIGHWGPNPAAYTGWGTHSNRLIPVYTFGTTRSGPGVSLSEYTGANSVYRRAPGLLRIYQSPPTNTLNPAAEYLDQTELASIQRAALAAGKKHIFVVIFDGMDWQTTWAASTYKSRKVAYREGRGTGLHFQDYTARGTTEFGWMVTTPHNEGTKTDVDGQRVLNPGGAQRGGYNPLKGGVFPWSTATDPLYLISKIPSDPKGLGEHAYPDSAATATAFCSGVKTYNDAINIDVEGNQVATVAHEAQALGMKIGVVTSVPISHATPACAYAHNVNRDDYQDLTRDLVGLPSIAHPQRPLPGVDVLIGGGAGDSKAEQKEQGANFVPGNLWITPADLQAIDAAHGGRYLVSQRTAGVNGRMNLLDAAGRAAVENRRLFGFYGNGMFSGHLPFRTADGDYLPTLGRQKKSECYFPADLYENPTLADMTIAALAVLERSPRGFWLMVEAGDVDWANHDNNLDNSIGAVLSGDEAVKVVTDWVERHSNWDESLLIVTADHGHYLMLDRPELLTGERP
ncbi:MAG: alkaline phosphatase [Planctomycetales bacterium]